ncbi:nicotinate-nucleotide/dimethylbenzimidazole phosphoribosyltransferase [Desulfobulbus propionicus DSM 2032]|uniref:Nicotinate-nucleotide--dimethylbenzimidazole phosphoribosyltransferase n=1 Tax=Desulfobulbus propionicus (strain ATCC 33891 / DSM 2032 / VKM B-1956 / 1pr3) TaxID=577650 RepID=A0A7U3YK06_DESPD|nr:nicotinate-nucleotide--dimethylbenzimidazole phosphoribosyltransferase [Desulfobulbus propionicus]ADW16765.1 nicotinate-nucleotide/dimethylbenzimidazole phosphoribosyltransferase [Desulfobulbus propionicus DSM 2032]
MHLLQKTLEAIKPIDRAVMAAAQREIDYCLKPPGSLGKLEDIARQIAGITGKVHNSIGKKAIVVMMADNGVYSEGVAMYPQDITRIGADFVTSGRMGVNFLANYAKADIIAVDIGIQVDVDLPKVLNRKIRYGTANFLKEPAMTREEAIRAVEVGIEVTNAAIDQGYDLIGTGEIGIGNTTASSAVLYAFTGAPIDRVVGRGAGLTDEAFARKKAVVQEAVRLHRPDPDDALDVLSKVGSLDIAGMAGTYLACAARRVPVLTDGLISNVAALVAMRLKPETVEYMIPSHISFEPGAKLLKEITGLEPMIDMDMRLGEGTGCALVFSIVEAALRMIEEMGTFAVIGKTRDEIGDHIMAYRGKFPR